MKTTNTELINILLWSWIQPNILVDGFLIVGKLTKRHGKMLYTDKYIKEISEVDPNISNLVSILKHTNKTEHQDIKNLIRMIKSSSDKYKPEFNISSDSKDHNEKLKEYIDTKFQSSKINTNAWDKIWVSISWEWRYYKKDLDSDLEKILNKFYYLIEHHII